MTLNAVKGYRVMIGMTQQDMADAIGMSRRTYTAKEAKCNFSMGEIKKIYLILREKKADLKLEDIFLE